jgi:hypothetical protein
MLGRELNLCVVRVELPLAHELPPNTALAGGTPLKSRTGCAGNLFHGRQ